MIRDVEDAVPYRLRDPPVVSVRLSPAFARDVEDAAPRSARFRAEFFSWLEGAAYRSPGGKIRFFPPRGEIRLHNVIQNGCKKSNESPLVLRYNSATCFLAELQEYLWSLRVFYVIML